MATLHLPEVKLSIKQQNNKRFVFDNLRKKYVALTPEEWVRQRYIHYLIDNHQYPAALIAVETEIKVNRLKKRCDILVHSRSGKPWLLVECKAPKIPITPAVFEQAERYNRPLLVQYLVVTNGLEEFVYEINYAEQSGKFLPELPVFEKQTGTK